jgi:uncharacterized protein YndB with AHSA1/START domain
MATLTDDPALEREVVITRRFAAPRALVFLAVTDPAHLARWWGPHGFTAPECKLDLRVGGALRIVMQAPDGQRFPMTGVIDELDPPERFAYRFEAHVDAGGPALRGRNAMHFVETGEHTELTVTARAEGLVPAAAMMLAGMEAGWSQSLEKLAATLA